MKISVENLGTIKKGEISLDKDLTIFTGENNSGKSYMSYLCYGYFSINNHKNPDYGIYFNEWIRFAKKQTSFIKSKFIFNGFFLDMDDVDENFHNLIIKFHEQFLNANLNKLLAVNAVTTKVSIEDIFQDKYKFRGTREFVLQINGKEFNLQQTLKTVSITSDSYTPLDNDAIENYMLNMFIKNGDAIYFVPAERTAINMFYNDIVKQKALENEELTRQGNITAEIINKMKEQGKLLPRSPKPITDYIYFCYDFRNYVLNPRTEFADLATELENLLGGGVEVSGFGDLQFQPTKQENQIPLYLSSSLVKSWSGVVIYLRHLAQKGDILMIDEPEINLHPKSQVLIAHFLAKMVNRGIRIVVSTHSDYILRELSTLIIANNEFEGKEKLLARYPEYRNQVLAAEKVAVYNFANHTIEKLEITTQGIEVESINNVIQSQTEISDAFYYTYLNSFETEIAD